MTRKDLEKFQISKKWTNARITFLEEQIKTIGKLNSILSDMPKGSRIVQDNEAESLSKLLDQIEDLKKEVRQETLDMERKIKGILELLNPTYGLLLYHFYILGDSIKYISKEVLHYKEKYVYDLRKKALEEFEYIQEKKG